MLIIGNNPGLLAIEYHAALAGLNNRVIALDNADHTAAVKFDNIFKGRLFGELSLSRITGNTADQSAADGTQNRHGVAAADSRPGDAAGCGAKQGTDIVVIAAYRNRTDADHGTGLDGVDGAGAGGIVIVAVQICGAGAEHQAQSQCG